MNKRRFIGMRNAMLTLIIIFSFDALYGAKLLDVDTLRIYRLGEVEVTDARAKVSRIKQATSVDVPYHILQNTDVMSVSDLQLYIPSAVVRTNSRGESMLFVRGSGERQLGLFLDGMSMNIPWDNRMDLSFVPADIIGNIRVNKSANSILYGPNILGGAVSISTVERTNPGYGLNIKSQIGDGGNQQFSVMHDGRKDNFIYIANASYVKSDGQILSSKRPDNLGNQHNNSSLRTNTDQERLNLYARGEIYLQENSVLGLSVSHTMQEKGVAAETFAGDDARFWRFPDRDRTILTFNGEHQFNENLQIRSTIWYDIFSQTIEDYTSFDYNEINEVQYDKDNTAGTRLGIHYKFADNHRLSYVLNGFSTTHKQRTDAEPWLDYSQNTISLGAEYSGIINSFEIAAGAGLDYNETPKTGLFTESEGTSQSAFAGFIDMKYFLSEEFALVASTSSRTRFPTMREQYDGALGQFKTNPDLKSEKGLLTEAGIVYANRKFNIKAVGFYNMYDDLIERIRLSEEEDPQRRRMRVNYSEASIAGVDINFNYQPVRNLNIDGFFTYMNLSAERNGEAVEYIVQKPDMLLGLISNYKFNGFKPQIEIEYTGEMWDNDIAGDFVKIDPAIILNIRLAYDFFISDFAFTEFFIRLNNITDEYKLSQYGLPEPGRTFYGGILVRL